MNKEQGMGNDLGGGASGKPVSQPSCSRAEKVNLCSWDTAQEQLSPSSMALLPGFIWKHGYVFIFCICHLKHVNKSEKISKIFFLQSGKSIFSQENNGNDQKRLEINF